MTKYYHFIVKGTRRFPIDMLRYDSCWPCDPESTSAMSMTFDKEFRSEYRQNGDSFQIHLMGVQSPTDGRWASFGWTVIESYRR